MIKFYIRIAAILTGSLLASGCATIVGGSKYNAHIEVKDRPNAQIIFKGETRGVGNASFLVRRQEANRFNLLIKENGYPDQIVTYHSRTFRGGAFVGTIVTWTGLINGIPIPWGILVDLATGALWKPNVFEVGVEKQNYKNFKYTITSTIKDGLISQSNTDDIIYLKNGDILIGKIIEQVPQGNLKIQSKNGIIHVVSYTEVERISKEETRF